MEHLRFATGILSRLGEELNPNPDQGIIELVRNSYDADAAKCKVELLCTDEPHGTIRVADDGIGMDREGLINGWLVLGRSVKQTEKFTERNRRIVGNKGLGRLAALRLGQIATVETRPKGSDLQLRLRIDWSAFDQADVVEAVELEIKEGMRPPNLEHGTTIEIEGIRSAITRAEVRRLARSLVLLADPFVDSQGFRPILVAPEFKDLEKLVQNAYFDQAELHLVAEVDTEGWGKVRLLDYKGEVLFEGAHEDLAKREGTAITPYSSPAAKFDLWLFKLDSETFSSRTVTLGEVKEWLREFGGVHLYHRALRVHPYGDRGHDWLDMNLSRVRSPELRPSTNTSIGKVTVVDETGLLLQKTDRSGFIENESFADLRRFAVDALDWMARRRLQEREARRTQGKQEVPTGIKSAEVEIKAVLKKVAPQRRKQIERALERYQKAKDREARTLREDLQLYRTLSTVGTTSAVLAHELKKPVRQIHTMAKMVQRVGKRELGNKYSSTLEQPISHILRASEALKTFANVTTTLLDREKRRQGRVVVHSVVEGILQLFAPFLDEAQVKCDLEFMPEEPPVFGSVSALESVIANLLTNSLNAFTYEHAKPVERRIKVVTEMNASGLRLRIFDNGPGIRGLDLKEIWLPGQTTTPGGTGLGLTIVRDAVTELGGLVQALAQGELGGAEFQVELPVIGGSS